MTRKVGGAVFQGTDVHVVTATPVLTVAATYASGDYVGTSAVPMTFAGVVDKDSASGYVISCTLIDYAVQSVNGELWLFDTAVTPPADSAAWSISDAHAKTCLGIIPFDTWYVSALNGISYGIPASPILFKCASGANDIYGCFVTRGAPAYASLDLSFRLTTIEA